jgi:hypothetical protein
VKDDFLAKAGASLNNDLASNEQRIATQLVEPREEYQIKDLQMFKDTKSPNSSSSFVSPMSGMSRDFSCPDSKFKKHFEQR